MRAFDHSRSRSPATQAHWWARELPASIGLSDGRRLNTLADARDLILGLTERRQANDSWQHVSELLMKVARGGATERDLAGAAAQLKLALDAEGLT
ncbi:MAG TPA: hypothetical protein VEC58_07915 [Roseiarcus sp.]|jgi:hypothetical protein|nr:hypothetical protein [Roseiarcus sp.]